MPEKREERIALDDLMVAMDAVDTLRHQERLVAREIDSEHRRALLLEKLREIYAKQGIEVTDAMLEEGVKALEEDRYRFHPPMPGFGTTLAKIYVGRDRWLKPLLLSVGLLGAGSAGYYALAVYPKQAAVKEIPKTLHYLYTQITTISRDDAAQQQANLLVAEAKEALQKDDTSLAKEKQRRLEALLEQLRAHYTIRIVQGANKRSGVWRIPPHNPVGKNYYLIFEAVDESGKVLSVPIHNEEDDTTQRVSQWGVRVDRQTYERVKQDKLDDGILQHRTIGKKERGRLSAQYSVPSNGGTITKW
jgi:hypothetical protein